MRVRHYCEQMKLQLLIILVIFLTAGCKKPFDKEFKALQPNEVGKALIDIDSLDECKKKWMFNFVTDYHKRLLNAEKDEKRRVQTSDYEQKTFGQVYSDFSVRYNDSVSKWEEIYMQNRTIRELIQIDTATVKTIDNELKIAIKFKPNQEIENATFEMRYFVYYNYENGVGPDQKITDYADYNIDGRVFRDTLTIIHSPRIGYTTSFADEYNSIGKNGKIKSSKSDEYYIDYTKSTVTLTSGDKLVYRDLENMPNNICIDSTKSTMPNISCK